ncbi:MAG: metal-dependent transcriptional regulator [Deltaproteobacteria bacterium]|nr:metal-dependent transcriptional regulator [Deltaproteobacteria bacterium]
MAAVSPAIQDYLKACYRLAEERAPVTMTRLAAALDVAAPSVTNMVKRMEGLRLVRRESESGIALTAHGRAVALEVIRHHRLLETFLVNELGMDWADAHKEAEVLEHYISERLEALLDKRLARPASDPHGEPIPRIDGKVAERRPPSLLDHPVDSIVTIARVESQEPDLLHYLQEHGLVPGAKVRIAGIAPFNGPVAVEVGRRAHHISREVAACIAGVKKR